MADELAVGGQELSLRRVFSEGWTAFKRKPGLTIGGFVLGYMVASFAWLFVGGPMAGGLCRFFLKIARDENADIGDLFTCFSDFWRWTGIYSLWFCLYIACSLPVFGWFFLYFISSGLASDTYNSAFPVFAFARFMIVYLLLILIAQVALLAAAAKWGFAFFEALEGADIIESFRRSSELTKGKCLRIWGILLVVYLFSMTGFVALYFGVFVTMGIGMSIITALYLELKRQAVPRMVEDRNER